jgi:hypothetical protein
MWYDTGERRDLNYSKPIVASLDDKRYLLIPQIATSAARSIKTIGYNWLDPVTGRYNSCTCWKDAREAVDTYIRYGYGVYNAKLSII